MTEQRRVSVQPEWCLALPLQQQSVLLLAARGPDGVSKAHPCKDVQRAYRATVLVAARRGRPLEWGEDADSFMSLATFGDDARWETVVREFYWHVDSLPHHFLLHLLHGAEIIAYKHPDPRFRGRWLDFYSIGCRDMHLPVESGAKMDERLNDWGQEGWA